MNKRNTILLILLAAQLVLLVALSLRGTTTAQPQVTFLAGIPPAKVVGLEISDQDGKELRLAREQGGWVLASLENLPVAADRIDLLLGKLTTLGSHELITRTRESHGRFLVAEKRFRQRLTITMADGAKKVLYLGTSPAYKTTHVRVEGDPRVYLVHDFSSLDLPLDGPSWWKTAYVDQDESKLTRVHITNAHGTLTLVREAGGRWEITEPRAGATSDPAKVQALVGRLCRIMLSEYLGQQDKEEYGLKTPLATLILTATTGETVLRVGAADPSSMTLTMKSSASPYFVRGAKPSLAPLLEANEDGLLMGGVTPQPHSARGNDH